MGLARIYNQILVRFDQPKNTASFGTTCARLKNRTVNSYQSYKDKCEISEHIYCECTVMIAE